MAGKVFINYRRGLNRKDAQHLFTQLLLHFPRHRLFIDEKGLDAAPDWLHELERQVADSVIMLALIGPGWADARGERGERRLDNREDFVRFEIGEAIRREIPLIPVRIDNAPMPSAAELPQDLWLMTRPQASLLRTESFAADAENVAKRIKATLAERNGTPWLAGAAVAVALAAGIAAGPSLQTWLGIIEPDAELRAALAKAQTGREAAEARIEDLKAQLKSLEKQLAVPAAFVQSPGQKFKECVDCPEMVVVPAGSFEMGTPPRDKEGFDDERPHHLARIAKPFAAGRFAVTFDEWKACADDGGCKSHPSPSDSGWGKGNRPVIDVSWNDAQDYVTWLNGKVRGQPYRLLTEAEWEYAARAGSRTRYFWGDSIGTNRANCSGCGSQWDGKQTAPVGSFAANAFGLHDMHGNVMQWTQDCWNGNYHSAPPDGSAWVTGDCASRVVRGGSWNIDPWFLRAARRLRGSTELRGNDLGFRVARTLTP
jgi:formylglycine-generating enzyme required for sulfatase activity